MLSTGESCMFLAYLSSVIRSVYDCTLTPLSEQTAVWLFNLKAILEPALTAKEVAYRGRKVQVPIPPDIYSRFSPGAKEFRLLNVLPADNESAPIKCKLTHHPLEIPPFYTALSYEWGDPSKHDVTKVDGTRFPAGKNLHLALQQLRSRKCPLLWIDAICINQQHNVEKSAHLPLMKDIYHQADSVTVWLGLESDGSDKAMQMLRSIDISRRPGQGGDRGLYTPNSQHLQRYRAELSAFLQRTFWQRAWIIQETASGSRVTLFCGPLVVNWQGLEILMPLLQSEPGFEAAALGYVRYLLQSRNSVIEGRPIGLLQALYDSRTAEATEANEKAFALVGLAFDGTHYVNHPDCKWSEEKMCFELTKSALWTKKSLDIIFAGAPSAKVLPSLPSWIPDYTLFGRANHSHVLANMARYLSGEDERYRAVRLGRRWNATRGTAVTRDTVQILGTDRLRVKCICIGTVNGLGAILGDNLSPQQSESSKAAGPLGGKNAQDLVEELSATYTFYDREYERHRAKPAITLYMKKFDYTDRYFPNKVSKLLIRFARFKRWRQRNKDFLIRGKPLDKYAGGSLTGGWTVARGVVGLGAAFAMGVSNTGGAAKVMAITSPPADLVATLESVQDLVNEGLRLMTTEDDQVGWAHPDAELGDKVFLLHGSSMPAVLRPFIPAQDGCFTVVGHAYIQGVMNGEVWWGLNREELKEIVLC